MEGRMGYQPLARLNLCPSCGSMPAPRRWFFRGLVRMECLCGVCGAWRPYVSMAHNDAAPGWEAVAGKPVMRLPRKERP